MSLVSDESLIEELAHKFTSMSRKDGFAGVHRYVIDNLASLAEQLDPFFPTANYSQMTTTFGRHGFHLDHVLTKMIAAAISDQRRAKVGKPPARRHR